MKKNVLLVEPGYQALYPPLALMKISTWHKRQGDNVDLIKHTPSQFQRGLFNKPINLNGEYNPYKKNYDIIYITTLFTYYFKEVVDTINFYKLSFPSATIKVGGILATLLPDLIEKETGIKPHIGLLDKNKRIEYCPPDYNLFPNIDYSISFTTRGCINNCSFCAVKTHEPDYIVKENWHEDINLLFDRIIFWDNNWFGSPNLEKDIQKLLELKKKGIRNIDFNQGLDCRLFNEDVAKAIKGIPIKPLRFAFDNNSENGHIQRAIKLAQKYGHKDIRVYVLYDSESKKDTPEYFYYRINEINKLGAFSYPMRFRPLKALNISQCHNFITNNWDRELLRALKLTLMFYYSKGMISDKRNSFLKIYGKNTTEFKDRLRVIYKKDKKRS
jgi:hypothetical protein